MIYNAPGKCCSFIAIGLQHPFQKTLDTYTWSMLCDYVSLVGALCLRKLPIGLHVLVTGPGRVL